MRTSQGKIGALFATTALACALSAGSRAQEPVSSIPGIPNNNPRYVTPESANKTKVKASPSGKRYESSKKVWAPTRQSRRTGVVHFGGGTFEKSIAVDPRVTVSLCVTQGGVKINGWSRNEVRVFVKDGSKIGFNIQQKNPRSGSVEWIKVIGFEPGKPAAPRECLWGNEVEIDAPVGAAVSFEGKATNTVVDTIRRISLKNAGGTISIRNVSEGVDAATYQGDVDVENSNGMISLVTTTGNILVFESRPSEVGDIFKARTNGGKISLQNLQHRQVEVNSTTGSIQFVGSLLDGGIYNLQTQKGSLVLEIPPDPPCFLIATYGYGNFNIDVPFKLATENISPGPIKNIKGTLGKGDCKLNLTNINGSIHIREL